MNGEMHEIDLENVKGEEPVSPPPPEPSSPAPTPELIAHDESSPIEKSESSPAVTEVAEIEKSESSPAVTEVAEIEKSESSPVVTEVAEIEKSESSPAVTEVAEIEKSESSPTNTDVPKTEEILNQVAKELKSFLAGNRLTLSNITGVVVDLYNFVHCYKSLTEHQKTLLLITVLTNFVKTEVDADPTLLAVIETLVPRIVDTLVGVSTGNINIGDIIEEIEEKAKGCWNCFTSCFKKH